MNRLVAGSLAASCCATVVSVASANWVDKSAANTKKQIHANVLSQHSIDTDLISLIAANKVQIQSLRDEVLDAKNQLQEVKAKNPVEIIVNDGGHVNRRILLGIMIGMATGIVFGKTL
jgi:hypothetical protein